MHPAGSDNQKGTAFTRYIESLNDVELYSFIESVLQSEEQVDLNDLTSLFAHAMQCSEWSVRALAPELLAIDNRIATISTLLELFRKDASSDVQIAILFELRDREDLGLSDLQCLFQTSKGAIARTTVSRLIRFNVTKVGADALNEWLEVESDPRILCNLHAARVLISPIQSEKMESRRFVEWSAASPDEEHRLEAAECLADLA